MQFICNLDIPRCPWGGVIPAVWARDCGTAYEARGLLATLLERLEPGQPVTAADIQAGRRADDPPFAEWVAHLETAGYLRQITVAGQPCYELIHPERLPALVGDDARDSPALSYGERKPYVVADNLDDLQGPTGGVITLPHHIDWSGSPTHDLDIPGMLASVYPTVLAEASTVADLNTYLNKTELLRLWPELYLPLKIARLWRARFPELGPTCRERSATSR